MTFLVFLLSVLLLFLLFPFTLKWVLSVISPF
jgi:hypothetical protein